MRSPALPAILLTAFSGVTATLAAVELRESPTVRLAGGTVHVAWHLPPKTERADVLIHFHGTPRATTKNFADAELEAVLVTVNFSGLSAAYATPFQEDPHLLDKILEHTAAQIRDQQGVAANIPWGRIWLSSFSAGYGAVREILKDPSAIQTDRGNRGRRFDLREPRGRPPWTTTAGHANA